MARRPSPYHSPMPRSFVLLLSLLLMACTHAESKTNQPEAEVIAQRTARFTDRSLPRTTLELAPVAEQAAVIEAQLRLRPDRRFLMAAGDVYEVLTGKRVNPEIEWA